MEHVEMNERVQDEEAERGIGKRGASVPGEDNPDCREHAK